MSYVGGAMPADRPEYRWIAANVRRLRIKKNWPQERLAEECGLSIRNVSVIEAGRSDLRFSSLLRLAEALEVPFTQLVAEPKRLDVPAMKPGEAKARERQKGRD